MAKICMTKKSAVSEHEKLVKVLRSGNKKALRSEAKDQGEELKTYRKKRESPRRSSRR